MRFPFRCNDDVLHTRWHTSEFNFLQMSSRQTRVIDAVGCREKMLQMMNKIVQFVFVHIQPCHPKQKMGKLSNLRTSCLSTSDACKSQLHIKRIQEYWQIIITLHYLIRFKCWTNWDLKIRENFNLFVYQSWNLVL